MPLNDNQKRRLLSSFRYVDGLLSKVEVLVAPVQHDSPFTQYQRDLSPVQKKVITDSVVRVREQMAAALGALDIPLPRPEVSSCWAVRTMLMNVETALVELEPEYLRGYGQVEAAAGRVLTGFTADLRRTVARLGEFLSAVPGQGFKARLEVLERGGREVGALREIQQAIQTQGLVEFRAALDLILERMESERFEIALFGRVSSGKSSLLDRILETEVLPVGVTPVTALPTRLLYGREAELWAEYADRPGERLPVSRLIDLVSEQGNPGNRRHVSRVDVRLPARRLREGICFVDTPGIGSLAGSGTEEALAYLPRCDLGVCLVDAESGLGPDDVRLLHLLYESGTPATVLLSKCDRVTDGQRERVIAYVHERLVEELGEDLQVYPVSVVGDHAALLEQWFEERIQPLYARHRDLARASLARKIGHLRQRVEHAVRAASTRREAGAAPSLTEEQIAHLRILFREGAARIEETRRDCRRKVVALPEARAAVVEKAIRALADQWARDRRAQVDAAIRQAITQEVEPFGLAVYQQVRELADAVAELRAALAAHTPVSVSLDEVAGRILLAGLPPAESVMSAGWSVMLPLTAWRRWCGPLRRHAAARGARGLFAEELGPAVEAYAHQLGKWADTRIQRLENLYDALAEGARLLLREDGARGTGASGRLDAGGQRSPRSAAP